MPHYKLNGQPGLDPGIDDGGAAPPSLQQGVGNSPGAPLSRSGPAGSSTVPGPGVLTFVSDDGGPPPTTNNATATTQTVTFPNSGLVFNNTFDGISAAYQSCVLSAEQALANICTNSVTINVEFEAQAEGQNGELASNEFWTVNESYASLKSALTSLSAAEPTNTVLQQAVANLPSTDPSGGQGFELPLAYAQILGLSTETRSPEDIVTLNTSYNWSYGQDVINTLEHEISEGGMGRIGGLGDQNSLWSTMDLFRYDAAGQPDYTDGRDGQTTYFSYNGGATLSTLSFNNEYSGNTKVNGGDTADFTQLDVFGTGEPGEINTLSATDIQMMEALGWAPPHQSPTVTGQNFLVPANQAVPIGNYFSVSNPPGDTLTQYVFKDEGGGNGYFSVNGVAQPDNTVISVSTANLSTVQYVGGPSPATDTLQVGVYDATTGTYDWSSPFTASTSIAIQTDNSTSLVQGGSDYFLCVAGTLNGPELLLGGSQVTAGEFSGWAPIGAVKTSTGYDVAWKDAGTGQYTVWSTDANGNYISNLIPYVAGNSASLEEFEPIFDQNLNGDGQLVTTIIRTDPGSQGRTILTEVSDQVASAYYLDGTGGPGPMLMLNGSAVQAGQFSGWAPIGAVQTATGYDVAWKNAGTGQYTVWSTDANGNYTSNVIPYVAGNNVTLESLESAFSQDLNGDGVTGVYAQANSTLQVSQSLSSAATIGAGATLELSAADSGSVTFQASTGMLKLDHPSTFTGTIYGFTGNSTLAGSDQIDLLGINYSTVHDSYSGGVLSISDGSGDNATLDFNGPYTLASFTLVNDGSGGTIVYDPPPVTSGSPDIASLGPMMSEPDDILSSDFADGFAGYQFAADGAGWLYSNTSELGPNTASAGLAGQGISSDASLLDPFSLASFGSNPPPSNGSDNSTSAGFGTAPAPNGPTVPTGPQFTAGLTTMVSGALPAFHDEWQATMGFAGTSAQIASNNLALTQLHHS
jgi:Tryptophan-rich Synechocystis species C-terminal domain